MDSLPHDAQVFNFDKTLATRLQECTDVLQATDRPVAASCVRAEWSYFVELQIEPTGWQAFWRLPRIICEEFRVAYPTVVFGTVEAVVFGDLRAHFVVTGVQDDDVQLPERHEVALVDLLAVRQQENQALNIEATANCVDMLRYFYQHVWRPWDNDTDDDRDWAGQHLERRIRFHHDLLARRVSRPLAVHIRALLAEAQDVQQRREYLETDISDDEDVNESLHQTEITDLMRLHLRLANIRSEMEILENPEMRKIYEDVRSRNAAAPSATLPVKAFIVSTVGPVDVQKQHLEWCETFIGATAPTRTMGSLQQCLEQCLNEVEIFLPVGVHAIKFAEPLQGVLTIRGRQRLVNELNGNSTAPPADCLPDETIGGDGVCIRSLEDDSKLMTVDGNVCIEGVTFDCSRVRTGIALRRGRLELRNCHFVGDARSNTKCAITVVSTATLDGVAPSVKLIDCSIRHFAVGINIGGSSADDIVSAESKTQVRLVSTRISDCGTAIACASSEQCIVHMKSDTRIGPNLRYGCAMTRPKPIEGAAAKEVFTQIGAEVSTITGACEFVGNALGNIVRFNCVSDHVFNDGTEDDAGGDATKKTYAAIVVEGATTIDDEAPEDPVEEQSLFVVPDVPKAANTSMSSDGDQILVSDSESEMSTSLIVVDD